MKIVNCANCIIEIDVEKTKQFYSNFKVADTQANRNYQKYCEKMSTEEKAFFENFGLNPAQCNVVHFGITRKKTVCCDGEYVICGRYIEYPQTELMTLEDFVANDFEFDTPSPNEYLGGFMFNFKDKEEDWEAEDPDESYIKTPEGFIKFCFEYDELPWLLKEKCETKEWEPPRFWEIHRIIKEKAEEKKEKERLVKEQTEEILKIFAENSVKAELMTEKQTAEFKKKWVDRFSPANADRKDIVNKCIKGRFKQSVKVYKCTPFLWHLFSFEYVKPEEDRARELYNKQSKETIFLFSSYENLVFKLENASVLDADFIEQFTDVVITSADFSWTYAKTHEEYCGPYFYNS